MSDIWIPTSLADLMDRVSILQVKLMHLEGEKREIVKLQHATLTKILMGQDWVFQDLKELEEINNTLWILEDKVRRISRCGSDNMSPEEGDSLGAYLSITHYNDERAKIKKRIDEKAGSELREVKSYV